MMTLHHIHYLCTPLHLLLLYYIDLKNILAHWEKSFLQRLCHVPVGVSSSMSLEQLTGVSMKVLSRSLIPIKLQALTLHPIDLH